MPSKASAPSNTDHGLPYDRNTQQFADLQQVKPGSVRTRLCETGSYFGIEPIKLRNGRLAWPAVRVGA